MLLLLALLPSVVILALVYWMDKYEKESHTHLQLALFLGSAIFVVAWFIEEQWNSLNLNNTFINAFFQTAFVEEGLKFCILMLFFYPRSFFNEPFDGIVYGVYISTGFATVENLFYVYGVQDAYTVAILRMFSAVPLHAVAGVLLGYYAGCKKFFHYHGIRSLVLGFVFAFLLHGLYDYFLLQKIHYWLIVFSFLVLGIGVYYSLRAMRIHQEASPFKP